MSALAVLAQRARRWLASGGVRRRVLLLALLLAVSALIAVALLTRPLGERARTDPTWARIRREGVVRVGMEASLPPFEWIDAEGRFQGLDVELATALAERWGVEVALVNISYDGLFDALKLGKVDMIISALPYDRTMTRDLAYSHSYFNAGQVLVVQEKDAPLKDIAQLPRLKVAVELGSEAHQTMRHLARDRGLALQIVPQREPEAALALLLSGEVDALVCDRVTAFRATTGRGEATPRLRITGQPLTDEPYVAAVRPDAPALLQQLNDAISEWHFGGKLEELQRHWF